MATLIERAVDYLRRGDRPGTTIAVGGGLVLMIEYSLIYGIPETHSSILAGATILAILLLCGFLISILERISRGYETPPGFNRPVRLLWNVVYVLVRIGGVAGWVGSALMTRIDVLLFDGRLKPYFEDHETTKAVVYLLVLLSLLTLPRLLMPVITGVLTPELLEITRTVLRPIAIVFAVVFWISLPAILILASRMANGGKQEFEDRAYGESIQQGFTHQVYKLVVSKRYVLGWMTVLGLVLIDQLFARFLPDDSGIGGLSNITLDSLSIALLDASIDFYILVGIVYVFAEVLMDPARGSGYRREIRLGQQARLVDFTNRSIKFRILEEVRSFALSPTGPLMRERVRVQLRLVTKGLVSYIRNGLAVSVVASRDRRE